MSPSRSGVLMTERKSGDIDNLWSLFEAALALADNDTEDNRQKFSEAYFDF